MEEGGAFRQIVLELLDTPCEKKREMNLTPSPKINSERIMELRRREALERGAEDTSGGLAMFLLLRKKKTYRKIHW